MRRFFGLVALFGMLFTLPALHSLMARETHFASCVTPKFRNTGHIVTVAQRIGNPPADVDNRSKANFCLIGIADPEDVGGDPCVCP